MTSFFVSHNNNLLLYYYIMFVLSLLVNSTLTMFKPVNITTYI